MDNEPLTFYEAVDELMVMLWGAIHARASSVAIQWLELPESSIEVRFTVNGVAQPATNLPLTMRPHLRKCLECYQKCAMQQAQPQMPLRFKATLLDPPYSQWSIMIRTSPPITESELTELKTLVLRYASREITPTNNLHA